MINETFNKLVTLVKDTGSQDQSIQIFKNIAAAMLKEACFKLNESYDPDTVLKYTSFVEEIIGNDAQNELIRMNCFYKKNMLDEAYHCIKKSSELPNGQKDSVIFYNRGIIEAETGRYTDAIQSYNKSIQLNPQNKIAALNLSQLKIKLGMWKEGWKEFEVRNEAVGYMIENERSMKQLYEKYDGSQDLKEKKIILLNDQGFGDLILFYRFFYKLKERGAKITLCAEPDIQELIRAQDKDISFCTAEDIKKGLVPSDYYCSPSSLIHLLDIKNDASLWKEIYIDAPKKDFDVLSKTKKNIALVHFGGAHAYDFRRSILLSEFCNIQSKKANLFLISKLHQPTRNWNGKQVKIDNIKSPYPVVSDLNTWFETAQLLKSIDLLITVDTGIAHLACAMGIPTWILLDYSCDYRWGTAGSSSNFYPSVKLFRQKNRKNWDEVFKQINQEIDFLCSANKP